MKTLKTEEVDGRRFKDIEAAKHSIAIFIDTIYNTERLHSALGYRPPLEFETNFALALNPQRKNPVTENFCVSLTGCSPALSPSLCE